MKSVALICLAVLTASSYASSPSGGNIEIKEYPSEIVPDGLFENIINKTLEALRSNIPEPIDIGHLAIGSPGGVFVGNASVDGLTLSGLKGFHVTDLKVSVLSLKMNFTINFPKINLNSEYWMDALLLDVVPLYGTGPANVAIRDLQISGTGQANFKGGLSVKNLRASIDVGKVTFDIHGVINNEDFSLIVSQVLNDTVGKFINDNQALISDILSPLLQAILDAVMGHNKSA